MKQKIFVFIFLILDLTVKGNIIVIDSNFPGYSFYFKTLHSESGKKAFLINAFCDKAFPGKNNITLRPLLAFQIYSYSAKDEDMSFKPIGQSFEGCLNQIENQLYEDSYLLNSDLMRSPNLDFISLIYDSLLLVTNTSKTLFLGTIKLDFFNVLAYKQYNHLQSNQTTLNIQSIETQVYAWLPDSIPVPKVDYIDKKIFLISHKKKDYYFFRYPERNEDSDISFPTGYLYRKNYGIVAIKTKYLSFKKINDSKTLVASKNYLLLN